MLPGHFRWFLCSLSELIRLHAIEVVLFMVEVGIEVFLSAIFLGSLAEGGQWKV